MLSRLRQSTDRRDKGFTLIELLVVMIIIGILAAIAIPVFLNQRTRAYETAIKSDLNTVATDVETSFVDTQSYPADDTAFKALLTADGVALSTGVLLTYTLNTGGASYCILGKHSKTGTTSYAYKSAAGGLGARNSTCP